MQTTIELSDDLLNQAHIQAERERTTLNRLIEEALVIRLRSSSAHRPNLPVYHGHGGLMPNVKDGLSNRALLDAADDLGHS
jgi:hypothetical protein